ncbi:MAG: GtrA family protein [Anaerolineae bacterium]|nr:GtrA family protein [Anaerolineae bacterium]
MTLLNDSRERSRLIKYSIVGGTGALVDFSVFNLLVALSLSPLLSSIFSFIAAVISNFTWNRLWTFPDSRSKPITRQLMEFSVVSVLGLAIRTPIFAFLEPTFISIISNLPLSLPIDSTLLGRNLALAVVIAIVMLWNFYVNRRWTFNDVD